MTQYLMPVVQLTLRRVHVSGAKKKLNTDKRERVVDFDLKTFSEAWKLIVSIVTVVGTILIFFWRRKKAEIERDAREAKRADDSEKLIEEIKEQVKTIEAGIRKDHADLISAFEKRAHGQDVKIAKVVTQSNAYKERLGLIEQSLSNMPDHKDFNKLSVQLADAIAQTKAVSHTVGLIHESLMRDRGNLQKTVAEKAMKK